MELTNIYSTYTFRQWKEGEKSYLRAQKIKMAQTIMFEAMDVWKCSLEDLPVMWLVTFKPRLERVWLVEINLVSFTPLPNWSKSVSKDMRWRTNAFVTIFSAKIIWFCWAKLLCSWLNLHWNIHKQMWRYVTSQW